MIAHYTGSYSALNNIEFNPVFALVNAYEAMFKAFFEHPTQWMPV
jgi:hypothetical protein